LVIKKNLEREDAAAVLMPEFLPAPASRRFTVLASRRFFAAPVADAGHCGHVSSGHVASSRLHEFSTFVERQLTAT
jgi:hypothetical protein